MRHRFPLAVSSLVGVVVLGGCGSAAGGDWAVPDDPFGEDVVMGDASVEGTEVTLDDGTVIDVGREIDTYVVAGDGVYVVPVLPAGGDEGQDELAELLLATPDGVEGTGAHPGPDTLRTSPDGRYLGFIDYGADPYTAPAAAVVVDLEQGGEVVRDTEDMTSSGDLEAVYDDNEPGFFAITQERAYVAEIEKVYSFALPSGERKTETDHVDDVYDLPWYQSLEKDPMTQLPRRADSGD